MTTAGTGKYTYELIQDWPKLPEVSPSASSAPWPPTPRTGSTYSSGRTRRSWYSIPKAIT